MRSRYVSRCLTIWYGTVKIIRIGQTKINLRESNRVEIRKTERAQKNKRFLSL